MLAPRVAIIVQHTNRINLRESRDVHVAIPPCSKAPCKRVLYLHTEGRPRSVCIVHIAGSDVPHVTTLVEWHYPGHDLQAHTITTPRWTNYGLRYGTFHT